MSERFNVADIFGENVFNDAVMQERLPKKIYKKLHEVMVEDFMCNLKVYRVAQGLTQEQLAEKVGVRRETIMRLEKAQYNPSLKLAIDISRVVEAPIEEIFVFK